MTSFGTILIILFGLIRGCVSNCTSPWKGVSDYRGICYSAVAPTKMNWSSAMEYCASQDPNATLPYFNDISEYQSYRYLALSLNFSSTSCDYHWLSDAQNTEWLVNNLTYAFPYFDDTTPASCKTNDSHIQHISTGYGWRKMCSSSENFFMCQLRYGFDPPVRAAKVLTCSNGWMADVWGNCYLYVSTAAAFENASLFCNSRNATLPKFCGIQDYYEFVSQQRYFANYSCVQDTWLGGISGINGTCLFDTYAKFSNETQFGDSCSSTKAYFCQTRKYGCPLPYTTLSTTVSSLSSSSSTTYNNDSSSTVLTSVRQSSSNYSLKVSRSSLSSLIDATRFNVTSSSRDSSTVTSSTAALGLLLSTQTVSLGINPSSNVTTIPTITTQTTILNSSASVPTAPSFTTSSTITLSSIVISIRMQPSTATIIPTTLNVTKFSTAYTTPLTLSSLTISSLPVINPTSIGPLTLNLTVTTVEWKTSTSTLPYSSTTAVQPKTSILTTVGLTFRSSSAINTSIISNPKEAVRMTAELPSPTLEVATSARSTLSNLSTVEHDVTTTFGFLWKTTRLINNSSLELTTENMLQTTLDSLSMSRSMPSLKALTSSAIVELTPKILTMIIPLTTAISTTMTLSEASILTTKSLNETITMTLSTTVDSAKSESTHLVLTSTEFLTVMDSSTDALRDAGSVTTAELMTISNLQIQSSSITSISTFLMPPTTLISVAVTTDKDKFLKASTIGAISTIDSSVPISTDIFLKSSTIDILSTIDSLVTIYTDTFLKSSTIDTVSTIDSSVTIYTDTFLKSSTIDTVSTIGTSVTIYTDTFLKSSTIDTVLTIDSSVTIYTHTLLETSTTDTISTIDSPVSTYKDIFLKSSTIDTVSKIDSSVTIYTDTFRKTSTIDSMSTIDTSVTTYTDTLLKTSAIDTMSKFDRSVTNQFSATSESQKSTVEMLKTSNTSLTTAISTTANGTILTTAMFTTSVGPSTTRIATTVDQPSSTIHTLPIYLTTVTSTALPTSSISLVNAIFTIAKQASSNSIRYLFSPTATWTESTATMFTTRSNYLTTTMLEPTTHVKSNTPSTSVPSIIKTSITTAVSPRKKSRTSKKLRSSTQFSTLTNTSVNVVTTSTAPLETPVRTSSLINIFPTSPTHLIATISTTISQASSTLAMLPTVFNSLTTTIIPTVKQTMSTEMTPSFPISIVPPTTTQTEPIQTTNLIYPATAVSENATHAESSSHTSVVSIIANSPTTGMESTIRINSATLETSNGLPSLLGSISAYSISFQSTTPLSLKITKLTTTLWSINASDPTNQSILANSSSASRSTIPGSTIIIGNLTTESNMSNIPFTTLGITSEKSMTAIHILHSTIFNKTLSSFGRTTIISITENLEPETSMLTTTLVIASLTSTRPSTVYSTINTSTSSISSRNVSLSTEDSTAIFTTSMMDLTKITNVTATSIASKLDNLIQTTTISPHTMGKISITWPSTTFSSNPKTSWTTTLMPSALGKITFSVLNSAETTIAVKHVSSRASTNDRTTENAKEWTTDSKKETTTKPMPETTVKLISLPGLITRALEAEQYTAITMPSSIMERDQATTAMLTQIPAEIPQQTRTPGRSIELSVMKLETAVLQGTTSMPTITVARRFGPQHKIAAFAVAVDYTASLPTTASRTIEGKSSNNVISVTSIQLQNSSSNHSTSRPLVVYPTTKLVQSTRYSPQTQSIMMIRGTTIAASKTTLVQMLQTYHSATAPSRESNVIETTASILSLIVSPTSFSTTRSLIETETMTQSVSDQLRIESSREHKLSTLAIERRSSSLSSQKSIATQSYSIIPGLSMKDAILSSTETAGSVNLTSFQQERTPVGTTSLTARRSTSNVRAANSVNVKYITETVSVLNKTLLPASLSMPAFRFTESIMSMYTYSLKPKNAGASNYLNARWTLKQTLKASTPTSQSIPTSTLNNMTPRTKLLYSTALVLYPNSTALKTIPRSYQFHPSFVKSTILSRTSGGSTAVNIYLRGSESAKLNFQPSQSDSARLSVLEMTRYSERTISNFPKMLLPTLIFSTTSESILTSSAEWKSSVNTVGIQFTKSTQFSTDGPIIVTESDNPQQQIQTSEISESQQILPLSTSPIDMVIPLKLSVFPHITQFTLDGGQILAATLVSPAYSVTRIHTAASYTNQQHLQMTTGPALATLILGLDVQYANMSKKSVPDDSQSFAELSTSEKLDVFGVDQVAVKDPMALTSSIQDSLSFIMQGLNDSTWSEIGEARASLVSDCLFNRQSCNNDREITTIRNNVYGNCFSFNNNNETVTKYSVSSGMENGFKLVLHINQSDYSCNVEKAGITMLIHDQEVQPTPETDGYYIQTGFITYFNIIQSKQNMMKPKCFDLDVTGFDYIYSVGNCQTMCYQDYMVKNCNCTDPRYMYVESRGYKKCSVEKKNCLDYYLTCNNTLDRLPCECKPKCSDISYTATITKTQMKTNAEMKHRCRMNPNADICSKNLNYALVYVFYGSLSVIVFSEDHAYGFVQMLSDFSGVGGLYVGIGSFTIFECMPFVYWSCKHLISLVVSKKNKM